MQSTTSFDSILVANRGEIAVRVIRTARELGYRTVAVYSEADAGAPHVALADEAILIGPPAVKDSYLDPARILEAARRGGAGAIHPGYGFLSENADFARACTGAGLVFIGPSAAAIDAMGNKAAAKRLMLEAGVPCIPGYQSPRQDDEALLAAAVEIGAPLMVKAAAGGGGRGMRLVEHLDALPGALAAARSEAENAFGSGELILEKAVLKPRHVEIQVFGDSHGNVIHLGERDCSVQRRHQKVVEEAPCPVLTPAQREAMGRAAVDAARAINYVGAGTVEFLLDTGGEFYFLEMNTRLQVEHPVTEAVTGLDLVALQLHIASGAPLPLSQEEVALAGHAIEVRLYAEDCENDFLPAAGTALRWQPPEGAGIRVDHGLREGQAVPPYYDPMIAKIIACGPDRESARRRLVRALEQTVLFGVANNRAFLLDVLERGDFVAGAATTDFITEQFPGGYRPPSPEREHLLLAACLQYRQAAREAGPGRDSARFAGWSGTREVAAHFRYATDAGGEGEGLTDIRVRETRPGYYLVQLEAQEHVLEWLGGSARRSARLAVDGHQFDVAYAYPGPGEIALQWRGRSVQLCNVLSSALAQGEGEGSGTVTAPMHGSVLALRIAVGDTVEAGTELLVMEAMKMEHRLCAEVAGEVSAVMVSEGDQVAAGDLLLEISS
ncbi:acetyl/propionyl/methylcrotonyl-CoA carboxylase subunit alpha [Parahaliea mediterranea]|uniref:Biotin carboxylase n=1 Tax=Parahaliea mediterranea TaxID=651086 RepID=A0A939DI78_9GAMM|nr:acetyl-CoA carboxylase biotin carboxylase subunit [Parahaliea mediterranea]MBN7797937.1 acetyl-CoA carboxylase biotin carboxylase subunit [Parahaliea mediterranea]